jgi:hypothetical protein
MEEREVKTVSIMTMVSKIIVEDLFVSDESQTARALLTMVTRTVREHLHTAFEGQPFDMVGLKLRLGPPPASFLIPDSQDGRTWALEVEVRAVGKGGAM